MRMSGMQREEILDEVDAAATRHREVGDDEVRPRSLDGGERLGHARGDRANGEVRLGVEHQLVAVEHKAVVVHEEEAGLRRRASLWAFAALMRQV